MLMHLTNICTAFCNSKTSIACRFICGQLDFQGYLSPLRLLGSMSQILSLRKLLPKYFPRPEYYQNHLEAFYLEA